MRRRRTAGSWLGASLGRRRAKLQHVFADGPAERAGLAAGDIARRGRRPARVGRRDRNAALPQAPPGETIAVHAFRRDELDHRPL